MRPFWLGVSALGSGVLFLDITIGAMLFGLYGGTLSLILVLAWCGMAFWLGRRFGPASGAMVYNIIAYIGACMAILLAGAMGGDDPATSGMCMALGLAVGAAGHMLALRAGKNHRAWIATAYLCIAALCLYFPQHDRDYNAWAGFCAGALCAAGLWMSSRRRMDTKYIFQLLVYTAQGSLLLNFLSGWAGDGAGHAFGLLVLCALCLGAGGWYYAGMAAPAYIAVEYISETMSECFSWSPWPYLIGPMLGIAALGLSLSLGDKRPRAGAAAFWAACLFLIRGRYDVGPVFAVVFVLTLLCAVVLYWQVCDIKKCWFIEKWDKLFLYMLPGMCLEPLADCFIVPLQVSVLPRPAPVLISLAGLYLYFNNEMAGQETDIKLDCAWRALRIAAFSTMLGYGVAAMSTGFVPIPAKITITIGILISIAFNIYLLALSIDKNAGVWACALANFGLLWLFGLWGLGQGAALSVLGILLAAACLYGGFRLKLKRLRLGGLAGAILWSVKLGLFDISNGTALGAAGGLLLAGLVCLGMSLAYNKLGRILEEGSGGDGSGEE
ncbi:MAG: hypothetical protein NC311_19160 [Muribaculaceae bacterium]|nr:hypothetical protein [Muribaculaceae bacterium]